MSESANIARHLPDMAHRIPDHPALKVPRGRLPDGRIDYLVLTFAELENETNAWVHHLAGEGIQRGDRVLVLVRQGLPLIASAFALFKLGAIPVLIDPGMGLRHFLACVERSRPSVLLGIAMAQALSRVCRRAFRSVRLRIPVRRDPTAQLATAAAAPFAPIGAGESDLAAILFTSGSTGAPKGVRYQHGMFAAQVRLIRVAYGIEAGEVDFPMLPIFALFNPALGMTTVVSNLNPSRPAAADPALLAQAIRQEKVTSSFGSPVLWRKIAQHCRKENIQLPSLRRILMAGAPVSPELFQMLQAVAPNAALHSPYGATESLPVSSISAAEVLGETAALTLEGHGTCVGRPLPEMQVRIIPLGDEPIAALEQIPPLPLGDIGEIMVGGPVVTRSYDDAFAEATAASKIADGDRVWHRMGDAGYLDQQGRLWFCGRKAERVITPNAVLFTERCEPIFNRHPLVQRSALIGLGPPGQQVPAVVIEPIPGRFPRTRRAARDLARELRQLGRIHPTTREINRFFFHRHFPVDVRHNAKIHRLKLAQLHAAKAAIHVP